MALLVNEISFPPLLTAALCAVLVGSDRVFLVSLVHDGIGVRAHAAAGETARILELPSGKTATVNVFARSCRPMVQTLVLAQGLID